MDWRWPSGWRLLPWIVRVLRVFLRPNIATPSITSYTHIPTPSSKEFQAHTLHTPHSNASLSFSIWISYGVVKGGQGIDWGETGLQSQFLAIVASRDLLLHATVRNPCHLQLMIGDQMAMLLISQQIQDLLSALCISTSRNHDNKSQCREVVADMNLILTICSLLVLIA